MSASKSDLPSFSDGRGEVCDYSGRCAGCPWIERDYQLQIEEKLSQLRSLATSLSFDGDPEFFGFGATRSRDRVDLRFERVGAEVRVGLLNNEREILSIERCPQMSDSLEMFFKDFVLQVQTVPAAFGSARLRVGVHGDRGVWLDLPNLSIKEILLEARWLESLLSQQLDVEMGQKRKRVVQKPIKSGEIRGQSFGLEEQGSDFTNSKAWSSTYLRPHENFADENSLQEVGLLSCVGGFSQPGRDVNKLLIDRLRFWARKSEQKEWAEVGCGVGNLTFALADCGKNVSAYDLDETSIAFAIENKRRISRLLNRNFQIRFERANFEKLLVTQQGLLVDPPRSGLGSMIPRILRSPVKEILYVSCNPVSWAKDVAELKSGGFELCGVEGIDLFPSTPQFEIMSRLYRRGV